MGAACSGPRAYMITEPYPWRTSRMRRLGEKNTAKALTALHTIVKRGQHKGEGHEDVLSKPYAFDPVDRSEESAKAREEAFIKETMESAKAELAAAQEKRHKVLVARAERLGLPPPKSAAELQKEAEAAAKARAKKAKEAPVDPNALDGPVDPNYVAPPKKKKKNKHDSDGADETKGDDFEMSDAAFEEEAAMLADRINPAKAAALFHDEEIEDVIVRDVEDEIHVCWTYYKTRNRKLKNKFDPKDVIDPIMERRCMALIYQHMDTLRECRCRFTLPLDFDYMNSLLPLPLPTSTIKEFHRFWTSLGGDVLGEITTGGFTRMLEANESVEFSFTIPFMMEIVEVERVGRLTFYEFVLALHTFLCMTNVQVADWTFNMYAAKSGQEHIVMKATTVEHAHRHGKTTVVCNVSALHRKYPRLRPDANPEEQNPFDQALFKGLAGVSDALQRADAALVSTESGFIRKMQRQIRKQREEYKVEAGLDSADEEELGWHDEEDGPGDDLDYVADRNEMRQANDLLVGRAEYRQVALNSAQPLYPLSYLRTYLHTVLCGESFWEARSAQVHKELADKKARERSDAEGRKTDEQYMVELGIEQDGDGGGAAAALPDSDTSLGFTAKPLTARERIEQKRSRRKSNYIIFVSPEEGEKRNKRLSRAMAEREAGLAIARRVKEEKKAQEFLARDKVTGEVVKHTLVIDKRGRQKKKRSSAIAPEPRSSRVSSASDAGGASPARRRANSDTMKDATPTPKRRSRASRVNAAAAAEVGWSIKKETAAQRRRREARARRRSAAN